MPVEKKIPKKSLTRFEAKALKHGKGDKEYSSVVLALLGTHDEVRRFLKNQ